MSLALYRLATRLFSGRIDRLLEKRRREGKEDPLRFKERQGLPSRPRPRGPLIWLHAASVGESVSVLPVIERLLAEDEALHVLLTTGTVTSAKLMEQRLPPRAIHQYVPVDRPDDVRRFLEHWHPDLAIWVESELWPNLIRETRRLGTPIVLLNARMSERSYRRWKRFPFVIRPLLREFTWCMAQSAPDAARLSGLGARNVGYFGNLKAVGAPLPADARELERLQASLANRPAWLAASTHPGEERIVIEAHRILRRRWPDLVTLIAPRHPERGPELGSELRDMGLAVRRRAGLEPLDGEGEIYLADTLGELGLFFRLVPVALVGGSLVPHGGHNPLEPARLGCAVLWGGDMGNFLDASTALLEAGAAEAVSDAASLAAVVARLLGDPAELERRRAAAIAVAEGGRVVLEHVMQELAPLLPSARDGDRRAAS